MKIVRFILALYIAAMAVYPCYEDDCMEEVCIVNSTDQEDHQKEDPDLCTPFCVSTCCAVHAFFNSRFESVFEAPNNSLAENSIYTMRFAPMVVVSIWQPPKLA